MLSILRHFRILNRVILLLVEFSSKDVLHCSFFPILDTSYSLHCSSPPITKSVSGSHHSSSQRMSNNVPFLTSWSNVSYTVPFPDFSTQVMPCTLFSSLISLVSLQDILFPSGVTDLRLHRSYFPKFRLKQGASKIVLSSNYQTKVNSTYTTQWIPNSNVFSTSIVYLYLQITCACLIWDGEVQDHEYIKYLQKYIV